MRRVVYLLVAVALAVLALRLGAVVPVSIREVPLRIGVGLAFAALLFAALAAAAVRAAFLAKRAT